VAAAARIEGPVLVLGGSGKMGPDLVRTLRRADLAAGVRRDLAVASTFSEPATRAELEQGGIRCLTGDLSDPAVLAALPDAAHVIYLLGFKFGSGTDWRRAFHVNSIVPYLVGERFGDANIVVFSSTNPYAGVEYAPGEPAGAERGASVGPPLAGGSREDSEVQPHGVYGWSIVAREASFATTAARHGGQRICNYRLSYAQHLCYGVLRDLADMVHRGAPISLAVPAVNLISQRDAVDVALRCLEHCANPPWTVNVSGPGHRVAGIVSALGAALGREPELADGEGRTAPLIDDSLCRTRFGEPRDGVEELIAAVACWVERGGASWDKPTLFGSVDHRY
jgi:nucleoside-diphosphate-sugar epimerase